MIKKVGGLFLLVVGVLLYIQSREAPTMHSYARYLVRMIDREAINATLSTHGVALVFKGSEVGCAHLRRVVQASADEAPPHQIVRCMVGSTEIWEAEPD